MDQVRIGQFIQELRKEKNITQKELAEHLGVSDKAVSKWENGRSMPDTSLLEPLCEELSISINELLSAEKLPPEDYAKMAEVKIMELLEENKKNRKSGIGQIIVGVALLLFTFWFLLALTFGANGMGNTLVMFIDFPTFIPIVLVCVAAVFITRSRGLLSILKTIKEVSIPTGLIIMLIGLVSIWLNSNWEDDIREILLTNMVSYYVAVIPVLYALVIYLVTTIWTRALENRATSK